MYPEDCLILTNNLVESLECRVESSKPHSGFDFGRVRFFCGNNLVRLRKLNSSKVQGFKRLRGLRGLRGVESVELRVGCDKNIKNITVTA